MISMKKIAVLLAASMLLSIAGCSAPSDHSDSSGAPSSSQSEASASSSASMSAPSAGTTAAIPEMTAAGSVEGVTYTNSVLGITYTVPEGWTLENPEDTLAGQLERLAQTQGQEVADSNKQNIDAGYTGYLFYASAPNETETSNLLVQIASEESVSGMSSIEYAGALAGAFEEGYKNFGVEASVEPAQELTIDGHQVALASVQVVLDGRINGLDGYEFDNYHLAQAYSVYTVNGAVVVAMLSAFSDEDLEDGMNALKSVRFSS